MALQTGRTRANRDQQENKKRPVKAGISWKTEEGGRSRQKLTNRLPVLAHTGVCTTVDQH